MEGLDPAVTADETGIWHRAPRNGCEHDYRYSLVELGAEHRRFALPARGSITLGRARSADLRLNHASVSRIHARLDSFDDRVTLVDLHSRNGTHIDGLRIGSNMAVQLHAGNEIAFGGVTVALLGSTRNVSVQREESGFGEITVGPKTLVLTDPVMRRLYYELLPAVAVTSYPVLLHGETGAGKDLVARRIHDISCRAGPFVCVNCAAVPEGLFESDFFGHERGAFTGAVSTKPGLFERADAGTLFLDEIGDLPLASQAKLLRALETGLICRIGATRDRRVDVRIIAATNAELEQRVAEGRFRHDLFYRLRGVRIMIPPLRERLSEIAPLAIGFLRQAVTAAGCGPLGLSDDAMAALHAYHWPGNVRELEHLLQSLAIVTRDAWIRREHLPDFLFAASSADDERSHSTPATFEHEANRSASSRSFTAQSAAFMRQRLLEALGKHGGNKTRAAAELGMPRTTLVAKLKQLGVVAGAPVNGQRRTGA